MGLLVVGTRNAVPKLDVSQDEKIHYVGDVCTMEWMAEEVNLEVSKVTYAILWN